MGGNTKSASSARRVPSTAPKVSTPPSTARPSKTSKQSKIIQLKLSSTLLARFPHEKASKKAAPPKPSSTPAPIAAAPSNEKSAVVDIKQEIKSSPAPSPPEISVPSVIDANQKGAAGPKTGMKRELGEGVEENPKSKSRPGPKKKQKLDNGVVDGTLGTKPVPGVTSASTHKLGPKANQGAINAGLRALDRSGTPCRKWAKRGFCIKTFTGVTWQIKSWRAPKKPKSVLEGDVSQPALPLSTSQSKENNSESIPGSEKSHCTPNGSTAMPSSPAPAVSTPA